MRCYDAICTSHNKVKVEIIIVIFLYGDVCISTFLVVLLMKTQDITKPVLRTAVRWSSAGLMLAHCLSATLAQQ